MDSTARVNATSATLSEPVRAFLSKPRFAVLATIMPDGRAQQTVVWYDLRDDHIMMNTAVGRVKTGNLERNAHISLCVADGYKYVTLQGTATLDYDQPIAQADIRALAVRYHGETEGNRVADERYSKMQRVTVRMSIERVSTYGFGAA